MADPFFGDPSRYSMVIETKTAPAVEAGFAAWWLIGLTVSALVVPFVLRWFYVVIQSTKKMEEEHDHLIPRESSDKLQLRLQEAERGLRRAQEALRQYPTTKSRNDYFVALEEVKRLKKQVDEKE